MSLVVCRVERGGRWAERAAGRGSTRGFGKDAFNVEATGEETGIDGRQGEARKAQPGRRTSPSQKPEAGFFLM